MFSALTTFIRRWRTSRSEGHLLDALLAHADANAPYAERSAWLVELTHWLRRRSMAPKTQAEPDAGNDTVQTGDAASLLRSRPEHVRLRHLLNVLDRNPAWKTQVALIVQRQLQDSDGLSLLCDAGMPVHSGFIGALLERITTRVVPLTPSQRDLAAIVMLMFPSERDADWIDALPADLRARLADLFAVHTGRPQQIPSRLIAALHTLSCQISSTGLSQAVRSRLGDTDDESDRGDRRDDGYASSLENLPFFRLMRAMQQVEDAASANDVHQLRESATQLRAVLDACHAATHSVFAHLYRHGVRVDTVFQVERMKMRIMRATQLLDTWQASGSTNASSAYARLVAQLVRANCASQSAWQLIRGNFALLSRKVVELNADTGEHYIARDRRESAQMLRMAAGGGLVTVVTVYLKFVATGAHFSPLVEGLLVGLNYAVSFLAMHFLHFSLATKQPAMTAPTIARELDGAFANDEGREHFLATVIALIRTQTMAVLGNVLAVFPLCLAVQLLFAHLFGANLISPQKAQATLHSFSLIGVTPLYAALTGVLLWFSSVLAGWADNWFVLHRVDDALAYNRRLRLTFGVAGAARLARFCRANVAGVAGNVTLGFMFGLVPALVSAVALTFEIRHVTLAAGSVAAVVGVLGVQTFGGAAFWWAVAGIVSMAVLNVGVSFALAFQMAARSRDLPNHAVRSLVGALGVRIVRHPLELVWPPAMRVDDARG